jgi:hypothetical protein
VVQSGPPATVEDDPTVEDFWVVGCVVDDIWAMEEVPVLEVEDTVVDIVGLCCPTPGPNRK